MTLIRTTEIPMDDPKEAKAIYDLQIAKKKRTIMIIIGNTPTFPKALDIADYLAQEGGAFGTERWVLWVKDHSIIKSTVELILAESKAKRSERKFETMKCFCLSPVSHKIEGIILKNAVLDYESLERSFSLAEKLDDTNFNNS